MQTKGNYYEIYSPIGWARPHRAHAYFYGVGKNPYPPYPTIITWQNLLLKKIKHVTNI